MLSFSLTIGTKPSWNKLFIVLFALIALLLCSVSSRVRSIWERFNFTLLKFFLKRFINSICPIEATAWLLSNFKFVFFKFNFLHPRAIAPEVIIITFLPWSTSFLTSLENSVNHFVLIFILLSINKDDPIFTATIFEFLRYIIY